MWTLVLFTSLLKVTAFAKPQTGREDGWHQGREYGEHWPLHATVALTVRKLDGSPAGEPQVSA